MAIVDLLDVNIDVNLMATIMIQYQVGIAVITSNQVLIIILLKISAQPA
jgi:hypothetical protein